MKGYILKRTGQAIGVIFFVATAIFFLVRLIPGDPVDIMLGLDAPQEARETLRDELGLDQPLYIQYMKWLFNTATGDLGVSIYSKEPVLDLLIGVAEPTVSIAFIGILTALLIGIPAGVISSVKQDSWFDFGATIVSFFGISMPEFWVGIILIFVFGSVIGIFPTFGYVAISQGIVPWLMHIILPGFAIGFTFGGIVMRHTRSSMLEALNEDFIRTARAKGLSPNLVIFKHCFHNALIPVVTIVGILLGGLLAGVVAVEIVFGIQGLGRLLIRSIERRDFPVIQGAVIVVSVILVFMNLLVDIVYTVIDPRIRY